MINLVLNGSVILFLLFYLSGMGTNETLITSLIVCLRVPWLSGCRVLRRQVALTSGRRSRKEWRRRLRRLWALLRVSPKEEKNWVGPARSRPSHRWAEKTPTGVQSISLKITYLLPVLNGLVEIPVLWCPVNDTSRVLSAEHGDHEEGDRCWGRRPLQSSLSAQEKKRILLQRRRKRLPSVRGQRVSEMSELSPAFLFCEDKFPLWALLICKWPCRKPLYWRQ